MKLLQKNTKGNYNKEEKLEEDNLIYIFFKNFVKKQYNKELNRLKKKNKVI